MARDPDCDLCKEEPGIIMWSDLRDGTTMCIGETCAPAFMIGIAEALGFVMLPADAVPVELGGTLTTEAPETASKRPRKRRDAVPDTDTGTEPADAATAAVEPMEEVPEADGEPALTSP